MSTVPPLDTVPPPDTEPPFTPVSPAAERDDIELGQLVRRLRPFALWIGLATVAATAGVYLSSRAQPRVYEAATSLMSVSGGRDSAAEFSVRAPPVTPGAVEEVLHSTELVEDIIRRLPGTSLPVPEIQALAADLRAEVKAQRFGLLRLRSRVDQQQRGVYEILARAGSPQTAKTLAGLGARSLLAWDSKRARQRYTRARQTLEAQLGATGRDPAGRAARSQVIQNIWELRLLESSAAGTLTLVSQPVTPTTPLAPRPSRDAALAGLLALLGSSGAALLLHRFQRRVRGAADLEALRLRVLGELPLPGQGPVASSRTGAFLGALGYLRLQLMPLLARAPQATVVVCAPTEAQGAGASAVVAALAAHLGASGLRVLVIDAQGGRSRQRHLWPLHIAAWHPLPGAGVDLAYGVATTLSQACLNPQVAQVARVSSHVDVLPADEPAQGQAVRGQAVRGQAVRGEPIQNQPAPSPLHQVNFPELLERWGSAYDVVLVDAPPLLSVPDALAAASGTAGLLLVADVTRARVPELEQALGLAVTTSIPVLGCVLTRPGRPAPNAGRARPSGYPSEQANIELSAITALKTDPGPKATAHDRHPSWSGRS
ncbi:chromosome partitioning protein [Deinococcus koreensis]|uniref:Chromosome partitioning protein n=1 Tax=Deinococcus koreensis TaxID=2054903 RepID=A0A2K3UZB5_9DEIO|nr:chromosome partitioning protein [Deinococcus koreensis]PNY81862.1 chromosome partitioning protein [Deinococcus koreensis]